MDRTGEPAVRLDAVSKRYPDGTTAVHELSLDVGRGELVVLVGPSGCGKTTTMKMVNRLVEPTTGRVLLDGEDVALLDPVQVRRRVGYVIQQVGLFPHLRVRENVTTVPSLLGWDRKRQRARADELLELVGLAPGTYADRWPSQLSGGQRQRVGVARALAADPLVLLMDEPFSAVDPLARERLQTEFLRLQRELGTTVVLVTHDVDEAVRLGDRIAVLRDGGHLEQYADPATVLGAPATPFVADFVGADRAVKRLSVTTIDTSRLESFDGPVSRSVPVGSDLGSALAVLLDADDGRVEVLDDRRPAARRADPAGAARRGARRLGQQAADALQHLAHAGGDLSRCARRRARRTARARRPRPGAGRCGRGRARSAAPPACRRRRGPARTSRWPTAARDRRRPRRTRMRRLVRDDRARHVVLDVAEPVAAGERRADAAGVAVPGAGVRLRARARRCAAGRTAPRRPLGRAGTQLLHLDDELLEDHERR